MLVCDLPMQEPFCYVCCSASMKQISPSPSSKHSPQIKRAPGFAHAFCPQSGQVNFVLLDFFALACLLVEMDCQWSCKPLSASFAYTLASRPSGWFEPTTC